MEDLDYEFQNGDVTIRVMKDHTYHVTYPLVSEPIITKCRAYEFYHLVEQGDSCDIYLNMHRGCYAVFMKDFLQKSLIKTIGEAREYVRNFKPITPLESTCSFAQFKRDAAIPGFTMTKLNVDTPITRAVKKIQSNAIVLNAPEKPSGESWLEFPPASLVEYNRDILRIYRSGYRFFNAEEKDALMEWERQRNIEEEERDAISDANTQSLRQKSYWKVKGMPYMYSTEKINGLLRDLSENVVLDKHIKGGISLEYKVHIPQQG